ncbi:cytochrome C oxidase subunit IV family protein [Marinobacterium arenosum]|uniref:cytochrome C oxidase subunit IV family protein n=1 Tax=Marinobacterium arenosum TaxID=2862496 RepID=UPI001C95AE0C|nr:cytochrome C oxidase subunit IV family protein [Marinobacterium arenosum]MBY4676470.1 cytochrome C oxidase subunit IV family protein [Marinobacterium arenosum]
MSWKLSDLKTWLLLLALTLSSALIAETTRPEAGLMLFICLSVALKGQLVIDNLMQLRDSHPGVRRPMRAYFVVVMGLIALAMLFPETLARITTL